MTAAPLALAALLTTLLAQATPAEAPPPAAAATPPEAPATAPPPAAPPPAEAPPAETPAPPTGDVPELAFDRSELDNGLELIVHSDPRLPVVCAELWVRVGAFDEERGKSGLAHLFEHLMFQGSKHNPGDGHLKLLEAVGGTGIEGLTDPDFTRYRACVPNNEVELLLWLEADRMAWMLDVVGGAQLDEQRAVVRNERWQHVDNLPYGPGDEALWAAMFPADHPYRGTVLGNPKDLDSVSMGDVVGFYDRFYAPSNATLAISGDIAVPDAKKLVDKYFRTLPKWEKPSRRTVAMPLLNAEVRVEVEDRLALVPRVSMAFFSPPAFQNGSADLEVLGLLLADGQASRLHQALVVDGKLAQAVSCRFTSMANVSVLKIDVVVRPEANPEDVVNGIQAQLDLLKDLPPSAEELERAVTAFETRRLASLQHPRGRAEVLQRYRNLAGDPGFLARDLARYRAVTPDTTLAAVNGFLGQERRAVAIVRPARPAPPPAAAPAPEAPAAPAEAAAPATPAEGASSPAPAPGKDGG